MEVVVEDVLAKRLAVQRDVSRTLASARGVADVTVSVLAAVGGRIGCAVGEMWLVRDERLQSVATWAADELARTFLDAHHTRAFAPGEGLPGHVWERAQPVWMEDVARMIDAITAAKLLGATTILTGMPGRVARTLVMLGIRLDDVRIYASLAEGVAALGAPTQ